MKTKNFKEKVLEIVSKIPRGKVLSYKEVAKLAGSSKAYRAVGNILKANHNPLIPCHRVIHSDGRIGKYNRGRRNKIKILKSEEIEVPSTRDEKIKIRNDRVK